MDIYTATEQAYKNGYEQGQNDAAENGTFIKPPCKFGDLLFCIDSYKSICGEKVQYSIKACRVTDIHAFSGGGFVIGVREIDSHYGHNVVIGERAFFTVEEAEAKLKELQNAKHD